MPINIVVCVKQVIDPETPPLSLRIDNQTKKMVGTTSRSPVVNGFDENALEAALRIKDSQPDTRVTAVSAGKEFQMDVIKKPLSMGCNELILLQDPIFDSLDAYGTATVLTAAIKKIGQFDLVLCGRQASDFDQAHVPLGIAEFLGIPCITITKGVSINDGKVIVEKSLPDGFDIMEAPLPAVATVSNELGNPRYPNLKNIMAAARTKPTVWTLNDLGLSPAQLTPKAEIVELFIPRTEKRCEIIEGENDTDKGVNLFQKLREHKLI